MSAAEALVRRFGDVLVTGRIEDLDDILAPDCRDQNPMPAQLPGRAGVAFKLAFYRALEPASRSRFVALCEGEGGAIAEWITEVPSGHATRWRGRFAVARGLITAFEVTRVV